MQNKTEQGGTEEDGTEQGGTGQEGTEQGGTEQGGTGQEGTEQGGTEQGGAEQAELWRFWAVFRHSLGQKWPFRAFSGIAVPLFREKQTQLCKSEHKIHFKLIRLHIFVKQTVPVRDRRFIHFERDVANGRRERTCKRKMI